MYLPLVPGPALVALSLTTMALSAPAQPEVAQRCTPPDADLAELSGLAAGADRWFAVADGGTELRVFVLNPADCAVLDEITAEVDPYDVEDLALAGDGALWLADTGDNDRARSTVALHRLTPDGGATLYRLTYPDGPHDAEALLLDGAGVPYLVTKELGAARVYRPAAVPAVPGPTPLEQVATVRLEATDTPGGPVGRVGSTVVTGGAVSADGQLVGLRTYTDAYLFPAPGGDVVAALAGVPVRIPLPGEPQGEALALAPDGTLLSGSEEGSGSAAGADAVPGSGAVSESGGPPSGPGSPPGVAAGAAGAAIRAVPGAAALAAPAEPVPPGGAQAAPETGTEAGEDGFTRWQAGLVAAGFIGLLLLTRRRARRAH